jgi:hypothetical protein
MGVGLLLIIYWTFTNEQVVRKKEETKRGFLKKVKTTYFIDYHIRKVVI